MADAATAAMGAAKAGGASMARSVHWNTALYAASGALSILTAPGPKRLTFQDFNFNPGDASNVVPYLCGTMEIVPHFIRAFDFDSDEVKNDVAVKEMILQAGIGGLSGYLAGGGHFNTPTPDPPTAYIGLAEGALTGAILAKLGELRTWSHRYYTGRLYSICLGPIDAIELVKVRERPVGTGTTLTGNVGTFLCDDPQAWGGDFFEGGIYWQCDVLRGDYWPTQQPHPYLQQYLSADVTAFSGQAMFIVRGPRGFQNEEGGWSGYFSATAGTAPPFDPLKLKVKRLPDPLSVPAWKAISTDDASPAFVAYEWFTDYRFGCKRVSPDKIDADSVLEVAEALFDENRCGISLQFNSNTDNETAFDVCKSVADMEIFGGFRSPGTIRFKLNRRDYSIGSLPVFRLGPDGSDPALYNVISKENFTPGAWSSTFNQFDYTFINRDDNSQPTRRTAPDPANQMLQQMRRTTTQDLQGVANAESAAFIGTRELRAGCYPRPTIILNTNRDGYLRSPGDVIKFIDSVDDVTKILRVHEVRVGNAETFRVQLVCSEDVYGIGASALTAATPAGSGSPFSDPTEPTRFLILDAPYFLTRDDDTRLLVFAARPNSSQLSMEIYVSSDGGTTYVHEASNVGFAITGTITEAVDRLTAAEVPSLTFTPDDTFEASRLTSATEAEIALGTNLIYWDDGSREWGAVEGITSNGDGTYDLSDVWRATLDATPQPHSAGARVWFFTYGRAVTTSEYADGTSTRTKFVARTLTDLMDVSEATARLKTAGETALKPLPVRNVTINAGYLTETVATGDLTIAWNETNRLTEGTVKKQTAAGVDPEDDTEYEIVIKGEDGGTLRTVTQTATSYVYTNAQELIDSGDVALEDQLNFHITVIRDATERSNTYIRRVLRVGVGDLTYNVVVGADDVVVGADGVIVGP